jgi:hypothetical protein
VLQAPGHAGHHAFSTSGLFVALFERGNSLPRRVLVLEKLRPADYVLCCSSRSFACAAARRAIGTRGAEQDT